MKLKVADLIVEIDIYYPLLQSRVGNYIYNGSQKADIVVNIPAEYYEKMQKEYPQLTVEECEYLWSGSGFYNQLIKHGGLLLHSSCVEYEGRAYLFSAKSGTGKSTHTHLWLKYLKGSRIVNDDKPAIRKIGEKYYAYGTPWSGKTDESINEGVEIGGIAFLNRGENAIKPIGGIKAASLFMNQTVRPNDKENMEKCLDNLNELLSGVPIYELSCDMSEDAVKTSYNAMKGH